MKKSKKSAEKRRHPILFGTIIGVLAIALVATVLIQIQMQRYERGILDVCAVQQDAYVQLVLDQINLNQNRGEEEIITDILQTIDGSSNKYWIFSREEAMLFVKDVLETNRYHGFTASSYYSSDSAKAFLNNLQVNRVIHADIEIGEKAYIASGVAFTYNGGTYRLCLLTNRSVLLDNNKFLGAKIELNILTGILALLIVLLPSLLAHKTLRLQYKNDGLQDAISDQNRTVSRLNKLLSEQDLHDTRNNVWGWNAMDEFSEKLRERKAYPSTLVKIRCEDETQAKKLLKMAAILLDKTVLRFGKHEDGEISLAFLFVLCDRESAMRDLNALLSPGAEPFEILTIQE